MSFGAQTCRDVVPRPPAKPGSWNQYVGCHQCSIDLRRLEWQSQSHPRPDALGTRHVDRSPMPLYDLLGAGQPDPGASDPADVTAAPVALEDLRQVGGGDADPFILHHEPGVR